jgi:hypothetical protein
MPYKTIEQWNGNYYIDEVDGVFKLEDEFHLEDFINEESEINSYDDDWGYYIDKFLSFEVIYSIADSVVSRIKDPKSINPYFTYNEERYYIHNFEERYLNCNNEDEKIWGEFDGKISKSDYKGLLYKFIDDSSIKLYYYYT